jgi:hypothetical protein
LLNIEKGQKPDNSISPSLTGFYERGKLPFINLGKKADNEEKYSNTTVRKLKNQKLKIKNYFKEN